jgi:hypothetical protein
MSLFESARNLLDKMTGKKAWKGATVQLNLEPSVVSSVAQVSLVPSGKYITPGKKLSASRTNSLTRFVDERLAMAKTNMDARSLCRRRGICSESMRKQYADYKESLNTHFGKSGIKVSLILEFNRGLEEYCECDNHIITGLDLSVKSLAIGTQLSADGNTCFSKYLTKTRRDSRPFAPTYPSLSPARVKAYERFLEQVNREIKTIVTRYHQGDQGSLMRKKRDKSCEREVQEMMDSKFPRLEHFFSPQTYESPRKPTPSWRDYATGRWHYRPFDFEPGKLFMSDRRAQVVEPLTVRLDDEGRSVES